MFKSLISWSNLLKRLNPAEEPFNGTALLVEFRIKPDRSSPLRMFPGSLVDWNIGPDPSFLVVLTNLPGIVGCICGDDRRANLNSGNHGRWQGKLCKQGGDRSDRPEHPAVPVHLVIAVIAGRSPFLPGYPSYPSHRARDQSFGSRSRIGAGRGRSPVLPSRRFEVVPVNHRFGTIFRRNVMPVQPVVGTYRMPLNKRGVTRVADVRLCWRR